MSQDQFRTTPIVERADAAAFDAVAERADPRQTFLRHAWFAGTAGDELEAMAARRPDGSPLIAIPRERRTLGPVKMSEVAGCYWPFRSVPVAADATVEELTRALADPAMRRFLGLVWRMGPVLADDPAAASLVPAARTAGWSILTRTTGTSFEFDFAALRADGPWPRTSSQASNRRRARKLEAMGEIVIRDCSGVDWTPEDREAMAQIERQSWFADVGEEATPKFADPARRRMWERAARDPQIAQMMYCSLMFVGGEPAAFVFGIEAGDVRHCIANSYSKTFAQNGAGKLLLYRDFERAADRGVARVNWGCGDLGYKSEMGATAGPDLIDLLFVRPKPLLPILRRLWT